MPHDRLEWPALNPDMKLIQFQRRELKEPNASTSLQNRTAVDPDCYKQAVVRGLLRPIKHVGAVTAAMKSMFLGYVVVSNAANPRI